MRLKVALVIIVFALIFCGCATIMSGTKEPVIVDSSPKSAHVEVKTLMNMSVFNGSTPANFMLDKKHEYKLTLTMEGYKPTEIFIAHEFDAWVIGNLLCGGIPGLIVDLVTGAFNHLSPNQIFVTMDKAENENGDEVIYAVLVTKDDANQLRYMLVPLEPEEL